MRRLEETRLPANHDNLPAIHHGAVNNTLSADSEPIYSDFAQGGCAHTSSRAFLSRLALSPRYLYLTRQKDPRPPRANIHDHPTSEQDQQGLPFSVRSHCRPAFQLHCPMWRIRPQWCSRYPDQRRQEQPSHNRSHRGFEQCWRDWLGTRASAREQAGQEDDCKLRRREQAF